MPRCAAEPALRRDRPGPRAEDSAPTAVPAAPTAAPTLTQYADTLKQQLTADKINVVSVEATEGALPTLTVNYTIAVDDLAHPDVAKVSTDIEQANYLVAKHVAAQVQAGTPIDRVVMALWAVSGDQKIPVANTRVNAKDMVAWSKGEITDKEYQARWSQTTN